MAAVAVMDSVTIWVAHGVGVTVWVRIRKILGQELGLASGSGGGVRVRNADHPTLNASIP